MLTTRLPRHLEQPILHTCKWFTTKVTCQLRKPGYIQHRALVSEYKRVGEVSGLVQPILARVNMRTFQAVNMITHAIYAPPVTAFSQ